MLDVRFWMLVVALASICRAHVGSPDVFYEGAAGPYRLLVTIRPPQVVQGVAELEIRSASWAADLVYEHQAGYELMLTHSRNSPDEA